MITDWADGHVNADWADGHMITDWADDHVITISLKSGVFVGVVLSELAASVNIKILYNKCKIWMNKKMFSLWFRYFFYRIDINIVHKFKNVIGSIKKIINMEPELYPTLYRLMLIKSNNPPIYEVI